MKSKRNPQKQLNFQENSWNTDQLFESTRWFLILGNILGTLPISGCYRNGSQYLTLRQNSQTFVYTFGVTILLIITPAVNISGFLTANKQNPYQISEAIQNHICTTWSLIIHILLIKRGKRLISIFRAWEATAKSANLEIDQYLKRDTIFVVCLIFISAFGENTFVHLGHFGLFEDTHEWTTISVGHNMTLLEAYYKNSHQSWNAVFGYHWILFILVFLEHKWFLYSWNYVDALIIVLARATYFQFKVIYENATKLVPNISDDLQIVQQDQHLHGSQVWNRLAFQHKAVCRLLNIIEDFLSPIIFGSYAVNIFYICLMLSHHLVTSVTETEIDEKVKIAKTIYNTWSIAHLLMRTYLVSNNCARVNTYAHKIGLVLRECPLNLYHGEVARLDKTASFGPPIGLTGLGCFVITNPFMMSLIGIILTFVIVLLQCFPSK